MTKAEAQDENSYYNKYKIYDTVVMKSYWDLTDIEKRRPKRKTVISSYPNELR